MKTIAELEAEWGCPIVAVIYDHDGTVYDHAFNWQSAQSMALSEGMRVEALKDDGYMSKDEIQRLCDAEKDRHDDCFGVS